MGFSSAQHNRSCSSIRVSNFLKIIFNSIIFFHLLLQIIQVEKFTLRWISQKSSWSEKVLENFSFCQQLTNLSTGYSVFFHGAMEISDISKQIYKFPKTDYTTVEFLALEIWTSEDAKKKVQFPFSFFLFSISLLYYHNFLLLL